MPPFSALRSELYSYSQRQAEKRREAEKGRQRRGERQRKAGREKKKERKGGTGEDRREAYSV